MESLNIAIIGSRGVGKSTFVQRVLGRAGTSSLRMVIDNRNYAVTLLELDLEHFDMAPDRPIQWPKQIDGHMLPRVDGALILYDVTDKSTVVDLPRTLSMSHPLSFARLVASPSARQLDLSTARRSSGRLLPAKLTAMQQPL